MHRIVVVGGGRAGRPAAGVAFSYDTIVVTAGAVTRKLPVPGIVSFHVVQNPHDAFVRGGAQHVDP